MSEFFKNVMLLFVRLFIFWEFMSIILSKESKRELKWYCTYFIILFIAFLVVFEFWHKSVYIPIMKRRHQYRTFDGIYHYFKIIIPFWVFCVIFTVWAIINRGSIEKYINSIIIIYCFTIKKINKQKKMYGSLVIYG